MGKQRPGYFSWNEQNPEECVQAAGKYFHENGYAVLTGHVNREEAKRLRKAGCAIMEEFYTEEGHDDAPIFNTENENEKQAHDRRFFESASNVTCFLEDVNEDTSNKTNEDKDKRRMVNKIGHALHDLNDEFREFSYALRVRRVLEEVLKKKDEKVEVVQSMYIVKGAHVGGVVIPHRDATFVMPSSEKSEDCVGLWWALENATLENGCLWVIPKSHLDEDSGGEDMIRFKRSTGNEERFELVGSTHKDYKDDEYVAVPVNSGDVVLLHGAVVHKSEHNYSERSRHAYSIHAVCGGLSKDCWIRRTEELPFRPVEF